MAIHQEILAEVRPDDLNEDMASLAELVGMESTLKIMESFSGVGLYVPKGGLKKTIERYILDNYDGTNARKLALRTGMTERFVYSLLERHRVPDPNQGELPFGEGDEA